MGSGKLVWSHFVQNSFFSLGRIKGLIYSEFFLYNKGNSGGSFIPNSSYGELGDSFIQNSFCSVREN